MEWSDKVTHYALTDVGLRRSHNQDSHSVSVAPNKEIWQKQGHLFVVADGMGAHAVGEMASKLAVDTIPHHYRRIKDQPPKDALLESVQEANRTINQKAKQNQEFEGMGTTTTALVLGPEGAYVAHVGDSRCYRIRGNTIQQLTFDHSLQWELARRQKVSPDKLTDVPANVIVRSMGPEEKVKIDLTGPYTAYPGDRFLICSDGLSGPVKDREMGAIVSHLEGAEASEFLVDLANLRGGIDNITLILVEIGEPVLEDFEDPPSTWKDRLWEKARSVSPSMWFLAPGGLLVLLAQVMHMIYKPSDSLITGGGFLLLVGLVLHLFRLLKRRSAPPPSTAPTQPSSVIQRPIHRQTVCGLEKSFIANLAQAVTTLTEVAQDQKWTVEAEQIRTIAHDADDYLKQNNLPAAFRLYCRLLSMFSQAMQATLGKQEQFNPTWERKQRTSIPSHILKRKTDDPPPTEPAADSQ